MAAYHRGMTLKVTCTPGSAPDPTLGNEYGRTLSYLTPIVLLAVAWLLIGHTRSNTAAPVMWYEWSIDSLTHARSSLGRRRILPRLLIA